jgi:NAD(P)-dependent dehydrogenase (short-subunit alcohol dehydrogenase family)
VGDVAQAQACVTATIAAFGRVDSLVNAAGLTTRGTLLDTTPDLFDAHVAVNLRAPFFLWDKIRVNGLDIGWTDTEGEDAIQRQFHGAGDDWRDKAGASLPMGKLGQVDEIADFVVFLLSDRSGVVTGSVIDWDQNVLGGFD